MQITVTTLTGKHITIDDVQPDTTVGVVKTKVLIKEGMPPDQQRLIFGGLHLQDHRTLEFYNIHEGSSLIWFSFASTDTSNPSTAFIMLSDEERGNAGCDKLM